jgi:hypothetical protein
LSKVFARSETIKEGDKVDDLYKKMELLSGADEKGRYWEIRPRTFTEVLRETDLVELADWIALELGWIRRDRAGVTKELERGGDPGELEQLEQLERAGDPGELERAGATISVGLGELECAAGVAGGDGELERGGDPRELGRDVAGVDLVRKIANEIVPIISKK